jgi:aminoglycoside 6'-N-acetyltransferase I
VTAFDVRVLGPGDEVLVREAAPGVFDHRPRERLVAEFLHDGRHHLVGAVEDGRLIGFVSAIHYVHPDKPAELWIDEVGVAAPYRRRGAGRAMMQRTLALARELGCRNAWVLADRGNTAAMRLYAAAGGSPSDAVMFEFEVIPGDT